MLTVLAVRATKLMDGATLLLLATVSFLSVYVIGVGGATASALRSREAWRHVRPDSQALRPGAGHRVVLSAPTLSSAAHLMRVVGWSAFGPALLLALFANPGRPWLIPLTVVVTVALNAFYFTAMQTMGEQLMLNDDGFQIGAGSSAHAMRWIHITDLEGARVGAFTALRMSQPDEWQDPRLRPNVILFRLNRALVTTNKNFVQRLTGLGYYDGVIRNAFGLPTDQLLEVMREWRQQALERSDLPLVRRGPGQKPRAGADRGRRGAAAHPGSQHQRQPDPHDRGDRADPTADGT